MSNKPAVIAISPEEYEYFRACYEAIKLIREAVENECKNSSNPTLLAIGINEIINQINKK